MSTRYHLSAYDRGRAVGRLKAGTIIARVMRVSKCIISRSKKAVESENSESIPVILEGNLHLKSSDMYT